MAWPSLHPGLKSWEGGSQLGQLQSAAPGVLGGHPTLGCCPLLTSCLPRGQAGEVGVQALPGLGDMPARPGCWGRTGAGHKSITPKPCTTLSPAGDWLPQE